MFSLAKNKSNFWLRELAQLQLRILKTTYCWKNDFLSFHGTVATFYSRGEQKQNCLSQISVGLCVYQKLFKSVYF